MIAAGGPGPVIGLEPTTSRGVIAIEVLGKDLRDLYDKRATLHANRAAKGEERVKAIDRAIERVKAGKPTPSPPPRTYGPPYPIPPIGLPHDFDPADSAAAIRAQQIRHMADHRRKTLFLIEELRRCAAALVFIGLHIKPEKVYEITDDVVERLLGPLGMYGMVDLDVDDEAEDEGALAAVAPRGSQSGVVRPIRPIP